MNKHFPKIVLASNNAGKVRELTQLLSSAEIDVIPQGELGVEEAIEDGLSFVENALIKARHACDQTGLPAIADDSGLEIDALQGEPGIYSARYCGTHGDDYGNNQLVLEKMKKIPDEQRCARFQCALAFMRHAQDPSPLICQASWEGRILHEARGEQGFGYDPLFWVAEKQCSSAELSKEEKNSLSHRGQALALFLDAFQQRYCP